METNIPGIKFRKLRKNKSDEDPKALRKALLQSKQSNFHYEDQRRQSSSPPLHHPPSLPSSPPSIHKNFQNFQTRQLGDWCRSKRLDEILTIFPPDMSLHEFSHLSPKMRQVSLGSPGRLISVGPHSNDNDKDTPMLIPRRQSQFNNLTAQNTGQQVVVTCPRMKEKVMVAITAARAARRQAEEASNTSAGGSPLTLSPNRRSLDVDSLGQLHHSRFGSASHRLSRELSMSKILIADNVSIRSASTRSLNTLGMTGLGINKLPPSFLTGSAGNLQCGFTGNT